MKNMSFLRVEMLGELSHSDIRDKLLIKGQYSSLRLSNTIN